MYHTTVYQQVAGENDRMIDAYPLFEIFFFGNRGISGFRMFLQLQVQKKQVEWSSGTQKHNHQQVVSNGKAMAHASRRLQRNALCINNVQTARSIALHPVTTSPSTFHVWWHGLVSKTSPVRTQPMKTTWSRLTSCFRGLKKGSGAAWTDLFYARVTPKSPKKGLCRPPERIPTMFGANISTQQNYRD